MKSQTKYTLVQHSGGGTGFEKAVEEVAVTLKADQARVERVGGVLFDTYGAASDAAMEENYPPGTEGIVPQAKGTFADARLNGLRIYVPAAPGAPVAPMVIRGWEVKLAAPVAGRRLILAQKSETEFVVATIPAEGTPVEWDLGTYRSDPGAAATAFGARYRSLASLMEPVHG
ncbi:hypothetical protein GCM10010331_44440 [Streptomyces xanthochromogenes]|uniref:hypothetical protein n=1 Tax=Streptomyces xanthochromogenes TaxID=67384 RepID=UPI0016775CD3|nr:hypothetical protein [Streptomyces xanthochromogenes]GHB51999.1 hypothetical protein GCM10010331_44440 [Streptomyces xanthochromogenes]